MGPGGPCRHALKHVKLFICSVHGPPVFCLVCHSKEAKGSHGILGSFSPLGGAPKGGQSGAFGQEYPCEASSFLHRGGGEFVFKHDVVVFFCLDPSRARRAKCWA